MVLGTDFYGVHYSGLSGDTRGDSRDLDFWQPYPSGFMEAAASGCVEGFGYDSFEGRAGECGRMTGTPRRRSGRLIPDSQRGEESYPSRETVRHGELP